MTRSLGLVAILVPDYEAGLAFYCGALGFGLLEDTDLGGGKRWIRLAPGACGTAEAGAAPRAGHGDAGGTQILLARAIGAQRAAIGNQGGGRVWLFLETEDFSRDHAAFLAAGVAFEEAPRAEPYGTVAVFRDPFGNRWDLIEYAG